MSLVTSLIGFGLRQVIGDAAGNVVEVVEQRFRDHSQTLPKALERAHDRAWQALEVALAGDGIFDRVKGFFASGDDKAIREQVAAFIHGNAVSFEGSPDGFRQSCLEELKQLRKSGLLSAQNLVASDVARGANAFQRHTDPQGLVEEARLAVGGVADFLTKGYPNLAGLLRTPTPSGPPLLAAAFAYFIRREVETNTELARGLFFDGLRQLSASQARGFAEINNALATHSHQIDIAIDQGGRIEAAVLDMHAELQRVESQQRANHEEVGLLFQQVLKQLRLVGMQQGEVRPQHSFTIRGEDERGAVKALLARFRQLPIEEQRGMPALLNGLGKLQVGTGEFTAAGQTFGEVVKAVSEPMGKAEAFHNAYRAALEQKKWDEALHALRQAATLDPQRFAPFPLYRYDPKRILGAGGFGTAFLCHDRNLDEDVVIKTLHVEDLGRGLNEVFREARIIRQLSHPAIIKARECDYANPAGQTRPYLVMDYFPGGSLEQFVEQRGTLTPDQLVKVALQVAQAMQAAHAQGILHRDLKPANILVRKEGEKWLVKIIDFGLALRPQIVESGGAAGLNGNTILGQSVAGTRKYAPPEQMGELQGVRPGTFSDVYAFGKTCYFALFHTTEPRSRHWTGVQRSLKKMLEACTEQELELRHANFDSVVAVLNRVVKGGPSGSGRDATLAGKEPDDSGDSAGEKGEDPGPTRRRITTEEFLAALTDNRNPRELETAEAIIRWAERSGLELGDCLGGRSGMASFIPTLDHGGHHWYPISMQSTGQVVLQMQWMRGKPPFDNREKRLELMTKVNNATGAGLVVERMTGRPSIALERLLNPAVLEQFLDVLTWMVQQIRAS